MEGIICSIVIATRNEERFIAGCIKSLEEQELDRSSYEIIIVDGMSEDKTRSIVKSLQKIYGNITLLENPRKIAPVAFNTGIAHSGGEYVFIAGAHAEYPPDFLKKSINSIAANNVDCVGGREVNLGANKLGRVFGTVRNTAFGGGLSPYRYSNKKQLVQTVAFGCYKRKVLIEAGGFDEELVRNQDNDLNKRIIKNGGKILFDPEIRFYYYTRGTLKGIARQMYGYGYWEARLIWKRKEQLSVITIIPALFVLYTLSALMMFLLKGISLFLWLEFIPYLLVYSYFAAKAVVPQRQNPVSALLLYLLIHMAIGTGFIIGLIGECGISNPLHKR